MFQNMLNNSLAGRYITAMILKRQGKSIKLIKCAIGYGLGIYFALALVLMPSQAHALTKVHCAPGEKIADTGYISDVVSFEDNSHQIEVNLVDNNDVYYALPTESTRVLRTAVKMIDREVEFTGTIKTATSDCTFVILTNWQFSGK